MTVFELAVIALLAGIWLALCIIAGGILQVVEQLKLLLFK